MNEEELLKRSAEERIKLFTRYEKGRDGTEIDPWEDPTFEVYHTTDRYGFIHDTRLPSKMDLQEAKRRQLEVERQKKWIKMLKNWNESKLSDKLHSRVYKGIPNSLRPQVWCKLLKVDEVKGQHPGIYNRMYELAKKYSTDARQIDSDVNRQFREHLNYRERYSIKQQQLFNVLTAYAMYNSEVGYCQGMSGLAAVLLMYMDEENAFWALHILLTNRKYAMHGYYKEGFPKLTRFLAHHDCILTKFLPKLKRHFDKHGLDAMLYSLKWFFICFVERVPFSLCLRVWDVHLLDGERIISAMAFTILKLHKRTLLKLNDMDSIVNYIQVKLYKDFQIDDDVVMQNLEKSMEDLKRAKLDYAGDPPIDELPHLIFGTFNPPTVEQIVGIRSDKFSEKEKQTNQLVLLTSDLAKENSVRDEAGEELYAASNAIDDDIGQTGSKFSFDPSMEDSSSLLDCEHTSSRRSLADTSVTSTADLSMFSTITKSQLHENSLDTHSNVSDNSIGGLSLTGSGNVGTVSTQHQKAGALAPHNLSSSSASYVTTSRIKQDSSPDILRIYVPYSPLEETPVPSPPASHNGDIILQKVTPCLFSDNKIRIKIDTDADDLPTPLVEHGQITNFRLDTPQFSE